MNMPWPALGRSATGKKKKEMNEIMQIISYRLE
jgi:hypothetical protein